MRKSQFTIRTLLIITCLIAVLLPIAISYHDDVINFFYPTQKPNAAQLAQWQAIIGNNREPIEWPVPIEFEIKDFMNENLILD